MVCWLLWHDAQRTSRVCWMIWHGLRPEGLLAPQPPPSSRTTARCHPAAEEPVPPHLLRADEHGSRCESAWAKRPAVAQFRVEDAPVWGRRVLSEEGVSPSGRGHCLRGDDCSRAGRTLVASPKGTRCPPRRRYPRAGGRLSPPRRDVASSAKGCPRDGGTFLTSPKMRCRLGVPKMPRQRDESRARTTLACFSESSRRLRRRCGGTGSSRPDDSEQ